MGVSMMIIALLIGTVGGFLLANKFIDHILMLLYYRRYLKADAYKELYDSMDAELYFELMKDHPGAPKSYDKYLLLNQDKSPSSYKTFRKVYSDVSALLFKIYGGGLLLSAIFYKYWLFLLVPVVLIHVVLVLERRIIKRYDQHFYLMMLHISVLLDKDSSKSF